jgi:hypothetical protein
VNFLSSYAKKELPSLLEQRYVTFSPTYRASLSTKAVKISRPRVGSQELSSCVDILLSTSRKSNNSISLSIFRLSLPDQESIPACVLSCSSQLPYDHLRFLYRTSVILMDGVVRPFILRYNHVCHQARWHEVSSHPPKHSTRDRDRKEMLGILDFDLDIDLDLT